jgi:hypothetical protein
MTDISSQSDTSEIRARILLSLFLIRNRSPNGDWLAAAELADAEAADDLERAKRLELEVTGLDEKAFELEANVYKAAIAAAEGAKSFISKLIRDDPSGAREGTAEVMAAELAQRFDRDIERANGQLWELRNRPLRDIR